LIDPGASEQDTTRRRAALSEFSLVEASQTRLLQEVADAFIAARLLTTNEIAGTTTIEVSHEALIREWPRLAGWLREARDDIGLQQTISKDATEWEKHNKPGDRLYRGSQLKEARAWARRNTPSGSEMAFLRAGAAQRLRSVVSVTVIVLLLLLTTGLAGWFLTRPDATHVTNLQDDGPGSLRQAVDVAPAGSTITFDANLRGTILLTSRDLDIAKNLKILSPGADKLSISSDKSGHIVHIIQSASVTISGLTFKDSNTSKGFILNDGTLTLSNSIVSGNTATTTNYGSGGIDNIGTLTLSNSTVSGNRATQGGGISNDLDATLTLSNSTVSDNTGGGISNDGTLTLSNSTVSDNTGDGIDSILGTLTMSNSTVSGNTGVFGGIEIDSGTLTMSNSTVSDNRVTSFDSLVSEGGGIAISDISGSVQVMLLYCTVYGNIADVGGGIRIDDFFYKQSQVTMGASIVAGNNAHTGPDIAGSLTTLGYNLVGDRSGATFFGSSKVQSTDMLGVSLTDLKIEPVLRDNSGSARPHTLTHALLPGSPAIDSIPFQYCQIQDIFDSQSRMYTDQRGVKRPDGNEPFCDIGAYEYRDPST